MAGQVLYFGKILRFGPRWILTGKTRTFQRKGRTGIRRIFKVNSQAPISHCFQKFHSFFSDSPPPTIGDVVATTSGLLRSQTYSQVGNSLQEALIQQVWCSTVTLGVPELPHLPVSTYWVVVFAVWVAWFCVCPPLSENKLVLKGFFWVC